MRTTWWPGLTALIVAAGMAGCVGGPSDDAELVEGPLFDDETGAIRGIVTSDALAPVQNVSVSLAEADASAQTSPDGSYVIERVPPGTYTIHFQALGYQAVARSVSVVAGSVAEVSVRLDPLPIDEPYHTTQEQEGLIGCGLLAKRSDDPNASHNVAAVCGLFGNAGFYEIDQFHLAWDMGDLEAISGAWGETAWTPTQAAGKGLYVLWTVWDSSNTAGGVYTFERIGGVTSPLRVSFTGEFLVDLVSERDTITDCTVSDCTIHTYHYGRAETLGGGYPVDVGVSLQQRYTEYLSLFYNQELPEFFTALPDQ